MSLLASNYDGVVERLILTAFGYGALSAAPFILAYLVMVSWTRGLRSTTLLVVAACFGFVVFTPLALWLVNLIHTEQSMLTGAIAILFCSLLPSIFLGGAIFADTQSVPAAMTPSIGVAAACLCAAALSLTEPGWQNLLFPVAAWHITVLIGLVVYARPAWKLQAIRPGHCPSCAYSTKGLAEGSPCPECGKLHPLKNV